MRDIFRTKSLLIVVLLVTLIILSCSKSEKQNSVNIGVILPLTGALADQGKEVLAGINIAADEINNDKDKKTPRINLIIEDDQSNPKGAVNAIEKIISLNHPSIIIGPVASTSMLAMIPIAQREKTVLLSPAASSLKISNSGKYIYRISLLAPSQSAALAQYCVNNSLQNRVGILFMNDETGNSYMNTFEKEIKQSKGNIVFNESFEKNATDFRAILQKLKYAKPSVVFVPSNSQTLGLILKQSRDIGLKTQFLANYGSISSKLIDLAGDATEGLIYVTIPVSDAFTKLYFTKKQYNPTAAAPLGYDALKIAWQFASQPKSNAETINAGLATVKDYAGASGKTTILSSGDAEKELQLMIVKAGKFEILGK